MSTVVVVTTHPLSAEDASDLLTVAGGDPTRATFHVAVPEEATSASMGAVIDDWELGVAAGRGVGKNSIADREVNPGEIARHDAQRVLDESVSALRATGATAAGEVTPDHPLESIGDIAAHHSPDEVVVMIRHRHLSAATHSDLASRIQRKFDVETIRVKAH